MTTDVLLALLCAFCWTVLAGVGIETANSPPDQNAARKWRYRRFFAFFSLAILCIVGLQATRKERFERREHEDQSSEKVANRSDQLMEQLAHDTMLSAVASMPSLLQRELSSVGRESSPNKARIQATINASGRPISKDSSAGQLSRLSPVYVVPTITSAPAIFKDGVITGKNFGSQKGKIFVQLGIKASKQVGIYEMNGYSLLGSLRSSNDLPLNETMIENWSETAIRLKISQSYWQELMHEVEDTAKSRRVLPPAPEDLEIGYEVTRSDYPVQSHPVGAYFYVE